MYGTNKKIILDEDDNSDIIKVLNDEQSYGGTDADWLFYYNRNYNFLWYCYGMVSE